MPRPLDPATHQALAERLRFYRDLGLTDFYRRPVEEIIEIEGAPGPSHLGTGELDSVAAPPSRAPSIPQGAQATAEWVGDRKSPSAETETAQSHFLAEDTTIKSRKPIQAPEIGVTIPAADRAAALQAIRDDIGDCTRCALHKGRNKIVFADGSPTARLMFVGEGPGADEDAQGLPFVGRAGQLLNNMITAMGLKREEVYIANVVKCRPPGNRTPEPDEANTCSQFLFRQIDVVRPQVLVALGATAATYLLGQRQPLAGLRGRVHAFRGMSLIVTYHPAFLLRDPRQKKEAWSDLQIAMKELGLKAPVKA